MFRVLLISIFLFLLVASAHAQEAQQDYIDQLMKLSESSSSQQYRDAIDGYKKLAARPGIPQWLKAGSEYELAELYATVDETENALAALSRAVQLGYDDCLSPRASEHLTTILQTPQATQVLARMKISEGDFRELVWLKSEVEHAEHDARMMITENINRVDAEKTEIPQAQLPTRTTNSAGVLYWRAQLLLIQKAQREYVKKSDDERIDHAATMGVINGSSATAAVTSARQATAAAAARQAEIRRRAFVAVITAANQAKPCSEWTR
jgi:tetratricopeptide (TPR) repeat protein